MPDYSKIKLVVLDVDGTLTDGGIYYDSQGYEQKRFDAKDGLGIKVAVESGLIIAILTGRKSPMVQQRADELGIQYLIEGAQVKYPALKMLLDELELCAAQTCFIGDDWNDLQCMQYAGVSMCPADAADEVIRICDYTTKKTGGHGAVRECLEYLLKKQGKWEDACKGLYSY